MRRVQLAPPAAGLRGIRAGSALGARGRASHIPPVLGSSLSRLTLPGLAFPATLVRHAALLVALGVAVSRRLTPPVGVAPLPAAPLSARRPRRVLPAVSRSGEASALPSSSPRRRGRRAVRQAPTLDGILRCPRRPDALGTPTECSNVRTAVKQGITLDSDLRRQDYCPSGGTRAFAG